jgi:hypothetical protein
MKFRIIIVAAALLAAIVGIRCLTQYARSPRRTAVGIAMDLSGKMSKPLGAPFELIHTSFLDSYDKDAFYVLLEFKSHETPEKLQEVFFFDAVGHPPQMQWSYSVFNNLAKLIVSVGAFGDDGISRIHQTGDGFETPIALSPVEWNIQGETITRLASQGIEMLVSIEGHPELKPFKIVNLNDKGYPVAEFSSVNDALVCAKVLDIKLTN